ncbi:DinB family protein [Dictyobacter arantiisoli]|uniref:DinB-like domain-containing protein n=1 Tax=Dictyobacter arantiisoli TaxID=2014874 RepID=A0A5A5TFS7_9CHLR|nr:DinB family protein [Dictyobacter arantiisoli]GCF09764.1 hypothetical protein KDI_33280 [Dictyobacter arantiisoli]
MPVATPEQIENYQAITRRIAAAIEGLSEEQRAYRPTEDDWNIHTVIIHLADSEAVGFWRLRKTLAEPNSILAVYDEDGWSKSLFYEQQDEVLALRIFTDLRTANANLLKLIPAKSWELSAIHAERGEISIYEIFQTYAEHGEAHLQQIETIRQALPA